MKSIEVELSETACLNGKTFYWNQYSGYSRTYTAVYDMVLKMMRKAIELGIVPDADLSRSDAYAQMQREKRDAHMKALSSEEDKLKNELASLCGEEANGESQE